MRKDPNAAIRRVIAEIGALQIISQLVVTL